MTGGHSRNTKTGRRYTFCRKLTAQFLTEIYPVGLFTRILTDIRIRRVKGVKKIPPSIARQATTLNLERDSRSSAYSPTAVISPADDVRGTLTMSGLAVQIQIYGLASMHSLVNIYFDCLPSQRPIVERECIEIEFNTSPARCILGLDTALGRVTRIPSSDPQRRV